MAQSRQRSLPRRSTRRRGGQPARANETVWSCGLTDTGGTNNVWVPKSIAGINATNQCRSGVGLDINAPGKTRPTEPKRELASNRPDWPDDRARVRAAGRPQRNERQRRGQLVRRWLLLGRRGRADQRQQQHQRIRRLGPIDQPRWLSACLRRQPVLGGAWPCRSCRQGHRLAGAGDPGPGPFCAERAVAILGLDTQRLAAAVHRRLALGDLRPRRDAQPASSSC